MSYEIASQTRDYTPQIIGLIGTILGTILGWFLYYITNTIGKLEISIDAYSDRKSRNDEYAYNLNLFFYNHSGKPNYIKDIKIDFYNNKGLIVESLPLENTEEASFRSIYNNKKVKVISLPSFHPVNITLCDVIDQENFRKLSNATKIVMSYKNRKNKKEIITIKENFLINHVALYTEGEMFSK